MQIVYGSPLPPGVEANTKGELRIRVEKLILDDETINHNPLVRLFDNQNNSAHHSLSNNSPINGSNFNNSKVVSPNKFVVPVDHCAISPLFWGEVLPTAQCQPATPQITNRGATTLVYPIKVSSDKFHSYLQSMSSSPHNGLQLQVFVPSTYSGRPPLGVGKGIVSLEELTSAKPVSGWFTIVHYQPEDSRFTSTNTKPSREDGAAASTANVSTEEAGTVDTAGSSLMVVPVGKVKLHISVNFFASPTSKKTATTTATGTASGTTTPHHKASVGNSPNKDTAKSPHENKNALAKSPTHHGRESGAANSAANYTINNNNNNNSANVSMASDEANREAQPPSLRPPVGTNSQGSLASQSSILPNASVDAASMMTQQQQQQHQQHQQQDQAQATSIVSDLLQKGMQLRDRMNKAVNSNHLLDSTLPPTELNSKSLSGKVTYVDPHTSPDKRAQLQHSPLGNLASGLVSTPAMPGSADHRGSTGKPPILRSDKESAEAAVAEDEAEQDSLYSSVASDEEQFAMQLQKETEEREAQQQQQQQHNNSAHDGLNTSTEHHDTRTSSHTVSPASPGALHRSSSYTHSGSANVELWFSDVSFGVTDMTRDLEEMRFSIRLSKDVATENPAAGPFSSFVHCVPLTQPRICLSLSVRSFSENQSKMVVECYKVRTRRLSVPGTKLLPDNDPNAPREIVSEELLGLAIVGLYTQSRHIVLHEPVSNANNVFSHLTVRVRRQGNEQQHTNKSSGDGYAEQQQLSATDGKRPSGKFPPPLAAGSPFASPTAAAAAARRRSSMQVCVGEENDECYELTSDVDASNASVETTEEAAAAASPKASERKKRVVVPELFDNSRRHPSVAPPSPGAAAAASADPEGDDAAHLSTEARRQSEFAPTGSSYPALHTSALSSPQKRVSLAQTPTPRASMAGPYVPVNLHTPQHHHCKHMSPMGERFRLHVAIHGARQLPLVSVGQNPESYYTSIVERKEAFLAPSSFFVVEEIFSGTERANTAAVAEWAVEATSCGFFDRTHVQANSQKPFYDYECVVNLPREGVFLQQQMAIEEKEKMRAAQRGASAKTSLLATETAKSAENAGDAGKPKPCLQQLLLTLWHYHGSEKDIKAANEQARESGATPRQNSEQEELRFWSSCAYMGEARIDLRPLRYLHRLDGYYRVLRGDGSDAEGAPTIVMAPSSAVQGSTIGYVHVGVALL